MMKQRATWRLIVCAFLFAACGAPPAPRPRPPSSSNGDAGDGDQGADEDGDGDDGGDMLPDTDPETCGNGRADPGEICLDDVTTIELGGGPCGLRLVDYEVRQRPKWVELIDMDRDGALDIVVSNDFVADLDVLRGRGDGTFDARRVLEIEAFDIAARFEAADLNGDQIPDLVTTHRYGNDVRVLLSNP